MTKRILLPLLLCAACTPAGAGPPEVPVSELRRDAIPNPPAYATQVEAPSPDHAALLRQPPLTDASWTQRKASAAHPPDAKAVGALWVERLEARGALLGHGLAGKGPDGPVNMIDTGLTEAEFEHWARENGWQVPRHIHWSFVPGMALPPVSEAAKSSIRVWPASTARTGAQHQALFHGRVELRDGCFFVGQGDGPADKLAWFHGEVGLDKDEAGFFILRDRVSGQTSARLGEDIVWGGPAGATMDEEAVRALRQACGAAEVFVVGSPESRELFMTRHPHLRQPQRPPPPPSSR